MGPTIMVLFYNQNMLQTICSFMICVPFFLIAYFNNNISNGPTFPISLFFFFLFSRVVYLVLELFFSDFSTNIYTPLLIFLQSFNFFNSLFLAAFYFDKLERNTELAPYIETNYLSKYYLVYFITPITLILSYF